MTLELMLSTMIGSLRYWSDDFNMFRWRELAWNANRKYLIIDELNEEEFEIFKDNYYKKTGEKIVDFVLADVTGASYGIQLGTVFFPGVGSFWGMIACSSILSGMVALT